MTLVAHLKPHTDHILLPPEIRKNLHRCQVFLSIAPANPYLLRIAIVPADERFLIIPTGEVDPEKAPKVAWLPMNSHPKEEP